MGSLSLLTTLLLALAQPAEEAAIRKLVANRLAAWERADAAALIADFADEADHVDSSGIYTSGKKAIEERYRSLLASGKNKGGVFKQAITRIRFIRPDVAMVDATWSASQLKSPDGKPLPDRSGTSVVIFTKESNAWKIASLRVAASAATASK